MSKRVFVFLLCSLIAALAMGCLPGPEPTPTSPSLLQGEVDFEVLVNQESEGSYITAGLARNRSAKLYSFHIEILYYDGGDKLIGTYPSVVLDLYPGMEKAFYVLTAEGWPEAARVDVRVTNVFKDEESSLRPDFDFGNLSVYHHEYGTKIFGEVTNQGDMQYSIVVLGGVFDEKGQVVQFNVHGIDNLHPGEVRMFAVDVLGEETTAGDSRVYVESITAVAPAQEPPKIAFVNPRLAYNGDSDRTAVLCDIVNRDTAGYRDLRLLIGIYEQGKLLQVTYYPVFEAIGAGETVVFEPLLFDGNVADKEVRIQVDSLAAEE